MIGREAGRICSNAEPALGCECELAPQHAGPHGCLGDTNHDAHQWSDEQQVAASGEGQAPEPEED